jgi:hypothetical protein
VRWSLKKPNHFNFQLVIADVGPEATKRFANSSPSRFEIRTPEWRTTRRSVFSCLTEKGVLAIDTPREVKTPKFSRSEGKTPTFSTEEVQKVSL